MQTQHVAALAVVDPRSTALIASNPRLISAALALRVHVDALITNIESSLESSTSRDLYVQLELGDARITPGQFRTIMAIFLGPGREPGPQSLTSLPDPKHRHVSTSSATPLLNGYLEDVLNILDEARQYDMNIDPVQAARLIKRLGRDRVLTKLESAMNRVERS